MAVDLRQLRAFVAVVDEGGFTDAAIALRTTQASVSRAVAALETALGARVLLRTTRPVAPTALGARVLEHARAALEAVAAVERVAARTDADLRVGYAWSALGQHTVAVQRRWAAEHPGRELVLVFANNPSAGLADGLADVAVLRRPVTDPRFAAVQVGTEERYAVLPAGDPLARRRSVVLADFVGRTLGLDRRTGTTGEDLWPGAGPAGYREVHGVEDFLTLVAAGQAVGMTSAATTRQHRRPGVVYRRVRDAPPVTVHLAWWREDPPPGVASLVALVRDAYAGGGAVGQAG